MSEDLPPVTEAAGIILRSPAGRILMPERVDTGDRLKLRRPILQQWADFICPADNMVVLKREVA
jgi:hypothetical protein